MACRSVTSPCAVVRVDDVRHPAARRVRDVLRSGRRAFVVDDEAPIAHVLAAGVELAGVYATTGEEEVLHRITRASGAPGYLLGTALAQQLLGSGKTARVFALARHGRAPTLADVTARGGDVVVLDGVRIPGNLGAVVRSACAFDAAGVVLLDSDLTSVLDRRLVRASRGLVATIPVVLSDPATLLAHLAEHEIEVVGLDAAALEPLVAIAGTPQRLALLLGSERRGASPAMTAGARRVRVPMPGAVDSLNVSVAAALALYQRQLADGPASTAGSGRNAATVA